MIDLSRFAASLNGKAVYVVGLGKSGLSTVRACAAAGMAAYAWDEKEEQRLEAGKCGAMIAPLEHIDFTTLACVILSPGIPLTHPRPHPVVIKAQEFGVEVIGDIEVLSRNGIPCQTVGITGTNGKSTTTALIAHVLNECGMHAIAAGNIGTPVLDLDLEGVELLVLEMSSYQIDLCPTFRPDIGVLLNVTPDHLDRHGTIEHYANVKASMFGPETKPVIALDDAFCKDVFRKLQAQSPVSISITGENADFTPRDLDDTSRFPTLAGRHNHQNALAALAVCRLLGLSDDAIFAAMATYPGLPHRQQIVRRIGDIIFINDSKATNAEASEKALSTYHDIYWIAGGLPKAGGLSGLEPVMERVTYAFLIGQAAPEFADWLNDKAVPNMINQTLDKAVDAAYQMTRQAGRGVVLLSPACASWDQFKSYEHRGEVFAELVSDLVI